jgi:hypothetical protein
VNIGHHRQKWKSPILGVARIVLRDVFLAYIFLAYVEPKLFFHFRAGKFTIAAPSGGIGILRESIEINITEAACTSHVDCLLLFLGCLCGQKYKVQLHAKVGVESFDICDWVHVLLSPPEWFMIECMWSDEAHEVMIEY